MAKIANVALTNTFDTWRSRSNEAFDRLSQFAINNSSLYANTLTSNTAFTAKGTATVTGLLTASGRATVGTNLTVSGNTTLGAASKTITTTGAWSHTGTKTISTNLTVSGNTTLGAAGKTANVSGWFGVTGRATVSTNLFVGGNTVVMGNMGVGTSSPSYTLDVRATTGSISSTSTTGTNYAKFQCNNTGGSYQFGIDNSAGTNFGSGVAYARVIWNDSSSAPTILYTNSTERMRISANGNVGINYASPTAKLLVSTASSTAYGLISQSPVVGLTTGNYVNMAYFADARGTNNDGLRIVNVRDSTGSGTGNWETSSYRIRRSVDNNDGATGVQEEIVFGASMLAFGTGGSERMRIASSGLITACNSMTVTQNLTVSGNTTLNGTTIDKSNSLSQTLTDGATINWDVALGRVATVTLGAAGRTMAAPTNLKVGTYILRVYQDGTGSRTITTWNAVFKWTAAVAPVLSTGASKLDIITFFSDGTNLYGSYLPDMR